MFFNYISVPPLPVLLLLLPLCGVLLIFGLGLVKIIPKFKAGGGKSLDFGKLPMKIIFFSVIVLETILSIYMWQQFQSVKSASYIFNYAGWATPLTGLASSALRANLQVDIFSASAAAMTSLVALVSCLRALPDREHGFTSQRAVFFLLTLCGVMGIYFAGGLIHMFFALTLSQIGASGLVQPVLHERSEFGRTMAYIISRFTALAMFLSGCAILALRYDIFSFQTMSALLRAENAERTAFALMAAPLLFLFIKPPHYTTDAANRCFFAIRANAAFFAFFKIVFVLYGAMSGLERVPSLIGMVGITAIFASLLFAAGERDPIKYATAAESSLKGFILVALAIALGSVYSVASVAAYGYDAAVAVISQWLFFLPVSAALSVTAVHLKQESEGAKLWLMNGMVSKLPFSCLLFVLAVCILGGLPPLPGYTGRQLLYRAANHINPFLTLALFIPSLFVLFTGLRYIFSFMFGKKDDETAERFAGDQPISLPLLVLICIIVTGTILPGYFHKGIVQPSVNFLLNGVRHAGYRSEPETEDEAGYDAGENGAPAEDDGVPEKEEGGQS